MFQDIGEEIILNEGREELVRDKIIGLCGYFFPVDLKCCKHHISITGSEGKKVKIAVIQKKQYYQEI